MADNNITDKSAEALANNQNITNLNIAGTNISAHGAKLFSSNKALIYLDFSGDFYGEPKPNDIGDEGANAIAHIKTLKKLYLSSQQITDSGANKLSALNLNVLDLSGNYNLGDKAALAFANKNLDYLDLVKSRVFILSILFNGYFKSK